jgi:hypothetical protein
MNEPGPSARRQDLLRALLIIAAGFWVFAPALRGDWLMDDDFYLPRNALLHDPHRLWKIWFAPGSLIEYYPIEASLQAIQWHFWHLDTLGYHLCNLLLHLAGALLVWRLLAKFGLRLAWLGGFLFAVHPAVVESVAWISEFKNTLSTPPFLLAMCFWIDFENRGHRRDYLLALGLFLVAMLCKIAMALFPFIILLHAWWRRGRVGLRDFKRAAPFAAISLVLGLVTPLVGNAFRVAHLQSASNPYIGGLSAHLALAGQSIAFYFAKCVWPLEMIPINPQWAIHPESPFSYWPWLVLAAGFAFTWSQRRTWGRHALLGLGFFLLNLLPFIGLNSVTYMGFTWVMDHFLYLPIIGLIGLAIAALETTEGRLPASLRPWLSGAIAVVLALLAWESETYADVFAGPEKLWSHCIAHNPTSWLPHNNLGTVYLEMDPPLRAEAIEQFQEALKYNPNSVEAHTNLGLAYDQTGQWEDAVRQYQRALQDNPHYGQAHANLGNVLVKLGRPEEAIPHFEEALLVNPNDDDTRATLERLKKSGNSSGAVR